MPLTLWLCNVGPLMTTMFSAMIIALYREKTPELRGTRVVGCQQLTPHRSGRNPDGSVRAVRTWDQQEHTLPRVFGWKSYWPSRAHSQGLGNPTQRHH